MRTLIYYFSGTGNSLYVARELAAALGGETRAIATSSESIDPSVDTIGLVYPVYFAGLPRMVVDFLKNVSLPSNCYFFAVSTAGGGPNHSFIHCHELLEEKGQKLSLGIGLRAPGNYLVLYGAFPDWYQRLALGALPKRIGAIAESVRKREVRPLKKGLFTDARIRLSESKSRAIASEDRDFWVTGDCNHCGICGRVCPRENIEQKDGLPTWHGNCEHCMACIQWCPQVAIQYGNKTKARRHYRNPNVAIKDMLLR